MLVLFTAIECNIKSELLKLQTEKCFIFVSQSQCQYSPLETVENELMLDLKIFFHHNRSIFEMLI